MVKVGDDVRVRRMVYTQERWKDRYAFESLFLVMLALLVSSSAISSEKKLFRNYETNRL